MTEMPVERLSLTPIPGGEDLVDLIVVFKDPETGAEWKELYPQARCSEDGVDESGRYKCTISRTLTPAQQNVRDSFLRRGK